MKRMCCVLLMLFLAESTFPLFAQQSLDMEGMDDFGSLSAELPDIEQLRSKWGYGVRLSNMSLSKDLGQYLDTRLGLGLFVIYNMKRHTVGLESNLSVAKARTDIPVLYCGPGESIDLNEWIASYGYRVVNNTLWRVTPSVGVSLFHLSNFIIEGVEGHNYSIEGYGPSAGLQVEYKYKRILKESSKSTSGYKYSERTIGLGFQTKYIVSQPFYTVNSQLSSLERRKGWVYSLNLSWGIN